MAAQKHRPGAAREAGSLVPDTNVHPLRDRLRAGSLPFWGLSFFGGGIAAVLVDLDHLPYYVFGVRGLTVPLNFFHFGQGRLLHPALFLIACGVLACAGGLLLLLVLSDAARAVKIRRIIRVHYNKIQSQGPAPQGANKKKARVPVYK